MYIYSITYSNDSCIEVKYNSETDSSGRRFKEWPNLKNVIPTIKGIYYIEFEDFIEWITLNRLHETSYKIRIIVNKKLLIVSRKK